MGQDLNKIENMYNTVAREWAANFFDEHKNKPRDREILLRFSQEIGQRGPVWDFGCGPGTTTKYLKNLGLDISGLDLSEKILEQARMTYPDTSFRKGNILKLEFAREEIFGVVAFYAIVHFTEEQIKMAFAEIFRVLKPGGIFLFTYHIGSDVIHVDTFLGKTVDIDFMFFTNDFIMDCLKGGGFERIELIEREPYPDIEYQSRRAYVFAIKPL